MGDDILNRPTGDQEGIWEAGTDLPFDPFASSAVLTDLELKCPRCKLQISTRESSLVIPWIALILVYFSACGCRRHRICTSGFSNGVSELPSTHCARNPGSLQVHSRHRPRSQRKNPREACVSSVSDVTCSCLPTSWLKEFYPISDCQGDAPRTLRTRSNLRRR